MRALLGFEPTLGTTWRSQVFLALVIAGLTVALFVLGFPLLIENGMPFRYAVVPQDSSRRLG